MTRILTSGFQNGFPDSFSSQLKNYVRSGMKFAFVASEFNHIHDKTDWYCQYFLKMFSECGITFETVNVIDSRMSNSLAQNTVMNADVVWLAGGDTPTQYHYLESYELVPILRNHNGVIMGMSAGSINMAETAICTITCEHDYQSIYKALGLVDFSVEPHFDKNGVSIELLNLSENYSLYGLSDDAAIICTGNQKKYVGDVFLIEKRKVFRIS